MDVCAAVIPLTDRSLDQPVLIHIAAPVRVSATTKANRVRSQNRQEGSFVQYYLIVSTESNYFGLVYFRHIEVQHSLVKIFQVITQSVWTVKLKT